ncbi:hypothetical protein [Shouchella clausii]|uniref:hypothetical protein n=1 Tax=Shouchella clausii TaxID=79880 RepID=UPI000BA62966|nr:hypothetical protein [Shouchella clausii]PAD91632.1 hypothetical protein CHH52_13490 [Shouchella clausii]
MSDWVLYNKETYETRDLGKFLVAIINTHDGSQTYYCDEDGAPFSTDNRELADILCRGLALNLDKMEYCEVQTLD